jgi:DNA topoisomerase I
MGKGKFIVRNVVSEKMEKTKTGKNKKVYKYSFKYNNGRNIANKNIKTYVEGLAIPPAYKKVLIDPDPKAMYSYTGSDVKGKKQYIYSKHYNEIRGIMKFCHLISFGQKLPAIRKKYNSYLNCGNSNKIGKERIIALILKIIDSCNFRIGNEKCRLETGSFGMTTLNKSHVKLKSNKELVIEFLGKHAQKNLCSINDPSIIMCIKQVLDAITNSNKIFSYKNGKNKINVTSNDVNNFLKEFGKKITTKNFRTWAANKHILEELKKMPSESVQSKRKKTVSEAIKKVAEKLHHTPAICKKEYLNPTIIDLYMNKKKIHYSGNKNNGLGKGENELMAFLTQYYNKYYCSKLKNTKTNFTNNFTSQS